MGYFPLLQLRTYNWILDAKNNRKLFRINFCQRGRGIAVALFYFGSNYGLHGVVWGLSATNAIGEKSHSSARARREEIYLVLTTANNKLFVAFMCVANGRDAYCVVRLLGKMRRAGCVIIFCTQAFLHCILEDNSLGNRI